MHWIILIGVLLAVIYLPAWWVRRTLNLYREPLDRIPGTGGELARHLLDRFDLQDVSVKTAEPGTDRYDPVDKTVWLSEDQINQTSLTSVAVAAHEVGHAIQDAQGHPLFVLRGRLVGLSNALQKLASAGILLIPVLMLLTKSPVAGLVLFLLSAGSMLSTVVIHLVTLPVELDASFNKALPILREGYIDPADQRAAERILRAAAFTYVASSVSSLLSFWRWFRYIRH